jgi:hypothetical protein
VHRKHTPRCEGCGKPVDRTRQPLPDDAPEGMLPSIPLCTDCAREDYLEACRANAELQARRELGDPTLLSAILERLAAHDERSTDGTRRQ